MRPTELAALAAALLALALGWRAFQWAQDKADPRRAVVRAIQRDASPTHDVVAVLGGGQGLIDALAPVPAVPGAPALTDLRGLRRLYVTGHEGDAFAPFYARLGAPTHTLGPGAFAWDVHELADVRFDLLAAVPDRVQAHRDGGPLAGPCTKDGAILRCHSTDDWNHLRVEEHVVGGAPVRCLFAHPQANSELVVEVPELPAARWLVGMTAVDDRAYFPQGAPVLNRVRFEPAGGGAAVEHDVTAPNQRGATPYRVALGGRAGRLRFSISTSNAGSRSYCFTAYATD